MAKISDLQNEATERVQLIINNMNKAREMENPEPTRENDRCQYSFRDEFGTKKTSLNINCSNYLYSSYSRFYSQKNISFELSTSLEQKSPLHLLVSVYLNIKGTLVDFTHEERINAIIEHLKYWVSYKENKKIKRLFFRFSDSDTNEIFKEVLEKMNYINIGCKDVISYEGEGYYGSYNSNIFRENIKDEEIERAIFIQKQIDKEMNLKPSFELQKKGSGTGVTKISNHTFYYLDNTFHIKPLVERVVVCFNENEVEFEYNDNVIETILAMIQQKMKLANLINPPIKNMRDFFEKTCSLKLEDSVLEDKVQEIDQEIGENMAESQAVLLNRLVDKAPSTANSWNKKIEHFKMSKEEQEYFVEHFGDEFFLCEMETDEYYWFLLVQKRNFSYDNIYLFPTKNEVVPEGVKLKAHEIVNARRNSNLMNEFESAMNIINELDGKCKGLNVSSKVKDILKDLSKAATQEFGQKWLEEK